VPDAFTNSMRKSVWRAVIETGFIVFLFYSNLLMGEFERSGPGQERGFVWALRDILTATNFGIAVFAALIGYGVVEVLRKRG
jgi:hypothetical protein